MPRRLTTSQFIEKAITIHGNRYDYSMVDYKNAHSKIKIICSDHGVFEQLPCNHLRGKGCYECCGKTRNDTNVFIRRAKAVHGDRYDYSKSIFTKVNESIIIICPDHGLFNQFAGNHLVGKGCSKCANNHKYTPLDFEMKARSVHGLRYVYDHSSFITVDKRVNIYCQTHGWFAQKGNNHLSGKGYPSCAVSGFKPYNDGTLYILRSECGSNMKIGISNNSKQRHADLRRNTPFEFHVVEQFESNGHYVSTVEKILHDESVSSGLKGFDGATEWFKYDSHIVELATSLFR